MQLHLKPSKTFFYLFLLAFLGAFLCIFYSNLPFYLRFFLALGLMSYGLKVLWQDLWLRGKRAVVTLIYCEDNSWQLKELGGRDYSAALMAASRMGAAFCFLRFKTPWGKRSCAVFRDALPATVYRRLLMRLTTMKVRG